MSKCLCGAQHWVLSNESVPLRGKQAAANENCIGRPATCRQCGRTRILPERVDFAPSMDGGKMLEE